MARSRKHDCPEKAQGQGREKFLKKEAARRGEQTLKHDNTGERSRKQVAKLLGERILTLFEKYAPKVRNASTPLVFIFADDPQNWKDVLQKSRSRIVLGRDNRSTLDLCNESMRICRESGVAHCVMATAILRNRAGKIATAATKRANAAALCLTAVLPEDEALLGQLQAECHAFQWGPAGGGFCAEVEAAMAHLYRGQKTPSEKNTRLLVSTGCATVHALVREQRTHFVLLQQHDEQSSSSSSSVSLKELCEIARECDAKQVPFFWIRDWARVSGMLGVDPTTTNSVCMSTVPSAAGGVHASHRSVLNDCGEDDDPTKTEELIALLDLIAASKHAANVVCDPAHDALSRYGPESGADTADPTVVGQQRNIARPDKGTSAALPHLGGTEEAASAANSNGPIFNLLVDTQQLPRQSSGGAPLAAHDDCARMDESSKENTNRVLGRNEFGAFTLQQHQDHAVPCSAHESDLFHAEQELASLESSIEILNSRRADADQHIQAALTEESRLQGRVDVLQRRTDFLSATYQKQATLQQCLDLSIADSKTRIEGLMAADVSLEDIGQRAVSVNTSKVFRRIDPNVALCPFELTGLCADPGCCYQHLEERTLSAVLPTELVPMLARNSVEGLQSPKPLDQRILEFMLKNYEPPVPVATIQKAGKKAKNRVSKKKMKETKYKSGYLVFIFDSGQKNMKVIQRSKLVLVRSLSRKDEQISNIVGKCQECSISHCVSASENVRGGMGSMTVETTGRRRVLAIALINSNSIDQETVRQLQEECHEQAVTQAGGGFCDLTEHAITDFYHRHSKQHQTEPSSTQPQLRLVLSSGSAAVLPLVKKRRAHFVLFDQSNFRKLREIALTCLSKQIPFFWISDWTRRVGDMLDLAVDATATTDVVCLSTTAARTNVGFQSGTDLGDAHQDGITLLLQLIAESKE